MRNSYCYCYWCWLKIWHSKETTIDYHSPYFETANHINEHYSWYNNLSPKTKEFIHDHISVSYLASERYKQNNMKYIIMGELPEEIPWAENIWIDDESCRSTHADEWANRVGSTVLGADIKFCWWGREDLETYLDKHPNEMFMISCAYDLLWGGDPKKFKEKAAYKALKRILQKENVMVSVACWNKRSVIKTLNENQEYEPWWAYTSASVNSEVDGKKKNNKITVIWFNANFENILLENNSSCPAIWFWDCFDWNIVMPFIPLVWRDNYEDQDTYSSYPTAALSGSLSNFLTIIMWNHPWITLEDANTIMINNYLTEWIYKYKDTDWTIKEWWKRYFFNTEKFIEEEILWKSEIEAIQFTSDDVELPAMEWRCYVWKWIQFECEWKRYDMTNEEDATFKKFVRQWKQIRWFETKESFLKYWWKWEISFDVYMLDKDAKKIEGMELKNIRKAVNW